MSQSLFESNFPEWYQQVIFKAELVDQSPARGCIVLRPYGYAIWEHIQKEMDRRIKSHGVQNAYFPLLIPESFLKKEADHIEGFSPELAVVTHAGGKELAEPYVIRPTSETVIYDMFSRWINSYRDLPLKLNQWANVMRWELRPRAFLRTAEILWQEGHTAHASKEEAAEMAQAMIKEYADFCWEYLAIPVSVGEKTPHERFAGAEMTLSIEGIMQDGKALQMGTSHLLQHSFPESFGVKFQAADGTMQTPWCTSWGLSTRLIGAVIMTHGDAQGLVLPPRVAPHQVVIIPLGSQAVYETVIAEAEALEKELIDAGVRVVIDRTAKRPGAKFFHWEERGAPLRVEIGSRDIENGEVTVATRIKLNDQENKISIPRNSIVDSVKALLETIHEEMLTKAKSFKQSYLHENLETFAELERVVKQGKAYFHVGWCSENECEKALGKIQCSIRCIVSKVETGSDKKCFSCSKPAAHMVTVAKSY